jgi:predicted HTH domain antitoxin
MTITLELPEDVAGELASSNGTDLQRALLEMVALEGYRSERLTHAQVGRLLGIENRFEVDAFLKEHGAFLHYTLEDLELDVETLRSLGV